MAMLAFVSCSAAAVLLHERQAPPPGWSLGERADPGMIHKFSIALEQQPEAAQILTQTLDQVSDPLSSKYGQYLTAEQIKEMVAVSGAAERVLSALGAHEFCSDLGDNLLCEAPVDAVERMFNTKLYAFHGKGWSGKPKTVYRAMGAASIPANISNLVTFVTGITSFFPVQAKQLDRVHVDAGAGAVFVTPGTLRKLYNVSDSAVGDAETITAVVQFELQPVIPSDTSEFAKEVGLDFSVSHEVNPTAGGDAGTEGTLDAQYAGSMGHGNSLWVWNQNGWVWEFCQTYQNMSSAGTKLPSVISMSYAWSEEKTCGGTTNAQCKELGVDWQGYLNRSNTELAKLGAMGVTVVVASGDSGCHGRTDKSCLKIGENHMRPDFPASSPYVVTVGGTQFKSAKPINSTHSNDSNGIAEPICGTRPCADGTPGAGGGEIVCSRETGGEIVSGGGFSQVTPRPSYQDLAVSAYLNGSAQLPSASKFNTGGRGFPDLAGLAHNYYIAINGHAGGVSGTSASTPVVAGLLGLINSYRTKAGKPTLGFANPLLYHLWGADKSVFTDVTEGSNRCSESGCFCREGFVAAEGWDATTGLGTPNFGMILDNLKALDRRAEV